MEKEKLIQEIIKMLNQIEDIPILRRIYLILVVITGG